MDNYEKIYKEAFKRARQIKNGENNWRYSDLTEIVPALEEVFPQLAESEDERIRKEISTLYADIDSCISELLAARTNKDAEAEGKALFRMEGLMVATLQDLSCVEDWLEKQKEQGVKSLSKEEYVKNFKALCDAYEIKLPNREYDIYHLCHDLSKLSIDSEEQKPTWSEEEKHFMDIFIARIFGSPNITTILTPDDCYKFEKALTKIRNKMDLQYSEDERQANKKHIDSLCSQFKPAEWSEKDEKIITALTKALIGSDSAEKIMLFDGVTIEMVSNFLKSLHPQPQLEWSEDYREEDIQTRFAFYTYKDDPSVLYLSNVFVEETSRNHGFGTRILRAAEKVAETIGAITISLKVKQDSPANAWYRKNGYGYVAFEDGYDWLEKNLEYMKPNKQEWSEEEAKKAAEDYADEFPGMTHAYNDFLAGVLWAKHHGIFQNGNTHWKPSEEQMEAFRSYIKDFQEKAEAAVGGWNNFNIMIQLFEQLNKLMQKG